MNKIKIIGAHSKKKLENKVNEELVHHSIMKYNLIDIKFTDIFMGEFVAYIIYEEKS